jgi:hypothetical protein
VPHPFRVFLRNGWDTGTILVYTISENVLGVEAQEVVPTQTGAGSRRVEVKASMRAMEIVVMQPVLELFFSFS